VLTAFDFISLAYLRAKVAPRMVMATSFIAFAFGNFVGFGLLTGGAVRARAYLNAGLETRSVAQLISLNGIAYLVTIIVFGSIALLLNSDALAEIEQLPPSVVHAATIVFVIVDVFLILMFTPWLSRKIERRLLIRLPTLRQGLGFLAAGALDIGLSALVLWLLLPAGSISYGPFAAIYTLALSLGLLSQIPGGVGVFEAVILSALDDYMDIPSIASALVLYRLVYYVLPLMVATGLVVWYELLDNLLKPVHKLFIGVAPNLLAMVAALVGTLLLFSGATPATREAEEALQSGVPLFLVEASHFFGSIAGLTLLLVTRGLLHRQNGAWLIAFVSAMIGALLALPKGVAVLELSVSLLLCLYLYLSRHLFTRQSMLVNGTLTLGWWLYLIAVLACSMWLLFFAYRDVEYSQQLWWQFEFNGHAPRSLRSMMTVILITFAVGIWQLLREPDVEDPPGDAEATAKALAIALAQDNPDALLVAMGDKSLHFSTNEKAFVMYRKIGRSWISLYDPVGPASEQADLIWDFIDRAERHGGRVAFYEVRPENLPCYLDAGMKTWKVGECAVVALPGFDLEGPHRYKLRQALKRGERDGLELTIIGREELPKIFPHLQAVSDEWLEAQNTREKTFSLGHFDYNYIAAQPIAIIREHGKIVAFATLQTTHSKYEVSLDLMRYVASAPKSCMEFLFLQLLLQFRDQGYQRFSLGMAPMSGMPQHRLANRWHKLAKFIYTHGEHFYNFQGLRAFKQKFGPEWEARYLVTTPGYLPIVALKDIAVLVSGGFKGVISK
jgi:phosphatidylglycerol lysyltransferase